MPYDTNGSNIAWSDPFAALQNPHAHQHRSAHSSGSHSPVFHDVADSPNRESHLPTQKAASLLTIPTLQELANVAPANLNAVKLSSQGVKGSQNFVALSDKSMQENHPVDQEMQDANKTSVSSREDRGRDRPSHAISLAAALSGRRGVRKVSPTIVSSPMLSALAPSFIPTVDAPSRSKTPESYPMEFRPVLRVAEGSRYPCTILIRQPKGPASEQELTTANFAMRMRKNAIATLFNTRGRSARPGTGPPAVIPEAARVATHNDA